MPAIDHLTKKFRVDSKVKTASQQTVTIPQSAQSMSFIFVSIDLAFKC